MFLPYIDNATESTSHQGRSGLYGLLKKASLHDGQTDSLRSVYFGYIRIMQYIFLGTII